MAPNAPETLALLRVPLPDALPGTPPFAPLPADAWALRRGRAAVSINVPQAHATIDEEAREASRKHCDNPI
ncbi:hypothetical protein GCM10007388_01980 [Pseudoduganella plicata]|uniref:Uncharacterized protein n=1 Tax=Pseudoduganella plicata TaxID=321984 RepID=A0AA88C6C9_9BURK|nr:hypothetical protein GCM10007388_01980 [Pseudoduganella plicata]